MNQRILELASQAEMSANQGDHVDVKMMMAKFAELIVRECARVYWNIDNGETHTEYVEALKQHFGVEE